MKLKGSIKLHVVHAPTGRVKQVIKKDNLIPNATLISLLNWNNNNLFGNAKISLSTSQDEPSPLNSQVKNIIATGYVPSGVTSPTWNDGIDPPFLQIQNRIDFIGTSRTFWTVALTSSQPSNNNYNNITATVLAYVKMDTSCTQGPEDFVDIYYRIQFAYVDGQNLTRQSRYDFGKSQVDDAWRMSFLYSSPAVTPSLSGYNNLYAATGSQIANVVGNVVNNWTSGVSVPSHFKFKGTLTKDLNDYVGLIFNSMLQGQTKTLECAYSITSFKNTKAPFQNAFWHNGNPPGPFFDSLTRGNSGGKILLEGEWTGKIPEMYRFTIVVGGATGTATYKWSVRKHFGFNGNTYTDRTPTCIYRNPNIAAHSRHHGWKDEDNDLLTFSPTQVVQYDQNGVTLLDVMSGDFSTWDSSSELPATDIRQCATDGSKIYVACRNTGLWTIDTVAKTVANSSSVPCYGVDVGRGKAYAIFNGRLSSSDNWSVPLAFVFVGLTDNNWSRAKFLKADPENTEDRLAIVADNGTGTNRVIWHRVSTGISTLGYTNAAVKSWSASLDVSDTGGLWAIRSQRLTWNAATITALPASIPSRAFVHPLYGSDSYYKVSFSRGNLITSDRTVNPTGSAVSTYTALPNTSFVAHLGDGIVLMDRTMRQLYNNVDAWTDYGWDGSKWVVGGTGTRTTHLTKENLNSGIQVSFSNAPTGASFTKDDFLTQSINWGLLKDNATRFSWSSQWYSKPAQLNSAAEGVIPTAAPYTIGLPALQNPDFVRVETDSPELHTFTIAGIPVATIYVAGEAPGPGEVSMKATGDGILTFNAADAGKTFKANPYAWVKS